VAIGDSFLLGPKINSRGTCECLESLKMRKTRRTRMKTNEPLFLAASQLPFMFYTTSVSAISSVLGLHLHAGLRTGRYAVIGCKLKQNANEGCNSCASRAAPVLCFIASFILLVIAPLIYLVSPHLTGEPIVPWGRWHSGLIHEDHEEAFI